MLVFKDIISGDEMMTDAYPRNPVIGADGEEVEGLFEVDSAMTTKGSESVDIGCGDAFGGEANDVDDTVEKVNNIIDPFKYTELPFESKAQMKEYLKDYVRAVRASMKEKGIEQPKIKAFMNKAPGIVKYLLSKYSDMSTYALESMNPEGAMAFGYYKDGAHNPTFLYIKDALVEEKF